MSAATTIRSNFRRYYLPVILWAIVIAVLSTSGFDTTFTYKLLKAANELLVLSYTTAQLREANAVVRKLAHVTEYFILGLLLWRALRRGRFESWRWSWAAGTLLIGASWAGLDELHQIFERGRGSSIVDVGWDTLGLLLALGLLFVRACFPRRPRVTFEGGSGESMAQAVIIRGAAHDLLGTYAMFFWLAQRFGEKDADWELVRQSHGEFNGRQIDTVLIRLADGSEKTLYFDVTESFGKW